MISVAVILDGVAWSGELIVDQKHPDAADGNPGTSVKPFRTIQAAMDKAGAGDTVRVRGGVYREGVLMKRSGSHFRIPYHGYWADPDPDYITLEAYQDEHVIVDGSVTIPAADWKLVEDRTNTYAAPFVSQAWRGMVNMVFCGDTMLLPALTKNPDRNQPDTPFLPTMPGDGANEQGYYYDTAQKQLYVNLGGQAPGKDAEMNVAQQGSGVDAHNQTFIRIRKLEIRRFNQDGIVVCGGTDAVVQDNYVHHCGQGINCGNTVEALIRRNIFSDIMMVGMSSGAAKGTVVEGNVIKRYHQNPYKLGNYSGSFMCNGSFGLILRNNVITESRAGGPWPDCSSMGIAMYGNTCYRIKDHGFYIEAGVYGTVLRWNTVFENNYGITFRGNNANVAFENYVYNNLRSGLTMGTPDQEDTEPKVNTMAYNWVINNSGASACTGPDVRGEMASTFDHNTYLLPPDSVLFQYGPKQYKEIADVRAEIGQEIHGQVVDTFDPAPLGLVTFRVNGTQKPWEPIPMFGNPWVKRADVVRNSDELYFWKKGDFQDGYTDKWRCEGFGGMGGMARASRQDGFLRQFFVSRVGPTEAYPGAKVDKGVDDATAARSEGVCLQVSAAPGTNVTAEGLGYWSVDLPTTDGAQIDLALWIRANKVKATAAGGGVYALAEFRDATGQNVSKQFLTGGEGDAKPVHPEFVEGTYAYKKLSGMVTAPAGARWFRMGFGLKSCSGWAAFDDFDIQTRPGVAEEQAVVKRAIEVEKYDWRIADISKLFNRPLADEIDGDGKGGWTDQGALMDLRGLQAGDYTFNGVLFRVEKGNACFIAKNKMRPSDNLPGSGQVELKGKADVVVFLQSGGWLQPDVKHTTYILHYADGSKAEIPVIGEKNILDWTAPPDRADELTYDPALGLLLHAVSVPSPQFVRAAVWMLLWKHPHPEKELAALEVKGGDEGIPGLIAVSRGIAK